MNSKQVEELLLQSLEHERGGVKIYKSAIAAAQREDLKAEWTHYLEQTEQHVQSLTGICEVFELDPFTMTPGTEIVKANGTALLGFHVWCARPVLSRDARHAGRDAGCGGRSEDGHVGEIGRAVHR
jgi:hypothetical protein